MAATQLHVYACSFCRDVIATSTVRTHRPPIRCHRCLRIMAYKWSQPITTQAERDMATAGVLFNPFTPPERPMLRACAGCHQLFEPAQLRLVGRARVCSQACADAEAEKLEAVKARVAQLREDRPWMA